MYLRVVRNYNISRGGMAFIYLLPGTIMKHCRWTLLLAIHFLIKLVLYLFLTLSPVLILSDFVISSPAEALVPTYSATKCCRNGFSLKFVPEELVCRFTQSPTFWISVSFVR